MYNKLALLGLCTLTLGCNLDTAFKQSTFIQPSQFSHYHDGKKSVRDYRKEAKRIVADLRCQTPRCEDYWTGYIDGFVDCLDYGRPSSPVVPHRSYWGRRCRSPEGKAAMNEWFAGFRDGTAMAETYLPGLWLPVNGTKFLPEPICEAGPYEESMMPHMVQPPAEPGTPHEEELAPPPGPVPGHELNFVPPASESAGRTPAARSTNSGLSAANEDQGRYARNAFVRMAQLGRFKGTKAEKPEQSSNVPAEEANGTRLISGQMPQAKPISASRVTQEGVEEFQLLDADWQPLNPTSEATPPAVIESAIEATDRNKTAGEAPVFELKFESEVSEPPASGDQTASQVELLPHPMADAAPREEQDDVFLLMIDSSSPGDTIHEFSDPAPAEGMHPLKGATTSTGERADAEPVTRSMEQDNTERATLPFRFGNSTYQPPEQGDWRRVRTTSTQKTSQFPDAVLAAVQNRSGLPPTSTGNSGAGEVWRSK